MRLEQEI